MTDDRGMGAWSGTVAAINNSTSHQGTIASMAQVSEEGLNTVAKGL